MEDFIIRYIIKIIFILLFACIYKIDFLENKDIPFRNKLFIESKLFEKYTLIIMLKYKID